MSALEVLAAGPSVTVQDAGRPGWLRYGLSEGGAMDRDALAEGAALLGARGAALEFAANGGRFRVTAPVTFALTGAPFRARLDGAALGWRTTHRMEPGQVLEVGAAEGGTYGYLHVAGGIDTAPVMGARSTHLRARIGGLEGRALTAGDVLPLLPHEAAPGLRLPDPDHLTRRVIRVTRGAQAEAFGAELERFLDTAFTVSPRRDRMGMRLSGGGFHAETALTGVSDSVVAGDVQIPGDGIPTVLMADRQATGGYPRIATVITADLAAMAQMPTGAPFRFALVDTAAAQEALVRHTAMLTALPRQRHPAIRDPHDIPDLLSHQLISGVIASDRLPWAQDDQ